MKRREFLKAAAVSPCLLIAGTVAAATPVALAVHTAGYMQTVEQRRAIELQLWRDQCLYGSAFHVRDASGNIRRIDPWSFYAGV